MAPSRVLSSPNTSPQQRIRSSDEESPHFRQHQVPWKDGEPSVLQKPPEPPTKPVTIRQKSLTEEFRSLVERELEVGLLEREKLATAVAKQMKVECTMQEGSRQLFIVAGSAESGKDLVLDYQARKFAQDYHVCRGRFDTTHQLRPYLAFVEAFHRLASHIEDEGEEYTQKIRQATKQEIGKDLSILTSMIPSLGRLLETAPDAEAAPAPTSDAATFQRFFTSVKGFVRALTRKGKPLLLMLQNVEHADKCSLDLLGALASHQNPQLCIVATVDESVKNLPLEVKYRDLVNRYTVRLTKFDVHPLPKLAVQEICERLFGDMERSERLASIVYNQTHGNVIYVRELLMYLQHEDCLARDNGQWRWVEWLTDDCLSKIKNYDAASFLDMLVQQRSKQARRLLSVAACLGPSFDRQDLVKALDKKRDEAIFSQFESLLDECVEYGVLVDAGMGRLAFDNALLHKAASALVPSGVATQFRLNIGRSVWGHTNEADLSDSLFLIMSLISSGASLVSSEKERLAVASLSLFAGQLAVKASSFLVAALCFDCGIEVLGRGSWRDEYRLTLALRNAAAEVAMIAARYGDMDVHLEEIFREARDFDDKYPAYCTRIYALGCRGHEQESIDLGIEVLGHLGETFPKRFRLANLIGDFLRIQRKLIHKSDEQLLRLPLMTDEKKLRALHVLNLMTLRTMINSPDLVPFLFLKGMKITLDHGLCHLSAISFCLFGVLHISCSHDIDAAFRYADIGLRLIDRFGATELLPRCYAAYYGVLWPWKYRIWGSWPKLVYASNLASQNGDNDFAALTANMCGLVAYEAGAPLDVIKRKWSGFQADVEAAGQVTFLRMSRPTLQAIHHLMGLTDDPVGSAGDLIDYKEEAERCEKAGYMTTTIGIFLRRTELFVFFNDLLAAGDVVGQMMDRIWKAPPSIEFVSGIFYAGLVYMEFARVGRHRRKHLSMAKKIRKRLKGFSLSSPHNLQYKLFLFDAELASLNPKLSRQAYQSYLCAIAMAEKENVHSVQALANERLGRHLMHEDNWELAKGYLEEAVNVYERWCAHAKVTRLRAEIAGLELAATEKLRSSTHVSYRELFPCS